MNCLAMASKAKTKMEAQDNTHECHTLWEIDETRKSGILGWMAVNDQKTRKDGLT